ncbi:RNA polymerase recycling motor HelD [Virgibacillus soli]
MTNEERNRLIEQERVDQVIDIIHKKQQKLYDSSTALRDSVIELRKTFWEDVTVNLDEPDDIIETEASLKQQAELLSERERTHRQHYRELKLLEDLESSPYFGRIDFVDDETAEKDKLYIGIASLMDEKDEDFLIYDWRAPISSLYYDYSPGKATYETVDGKITGEMTLKRQFIIDNGHIDGMFDTGVTIGDRLLQEALGNNASAMMKSIVATIQSEQNKIIRNEKSNLMLVQGAAGSGKTSAVLQRVAFLMYRYRETLNAQNMLLFSPNPLFSGYIANVLPELGEENIRQKTFYHFLKDSIEKKLTVESPFQQMEYVLTKQTDQDYEVRMNSIAYKSTLSYKDLLDRYVNKLAETGVYFRNITFRKQILVSKEKITSYFYSLDEDMILPNKMEIVAKWLVTELENIERDEREKDWVMEEVELLDKEDYLQAYYKNQAIDEENFGLEEQLLRKEVVKRYFGPMKRKVKRFAFVNILATYFALFKEQTVTPVALQDWEDICQLTMTSLANGVLTWEDATPFLYLQDQLLGNHVKGEIKHLFIDEAQDYSAFQFAYIKYLFPYTQMTLLGDMNQTIYHYATKNHPLISENRESVERVTLTKSYRSTTEIVTFTKTFAPSSEIIEPFHREGKKPQLIKLEKCDPVDLTIVNVTKKLLEQGYETIGVISKSAAQTAKLYHNLKGQLPVKMIHEETYQFDKGILILPVYLAKGIEFDAVIIPDASEKNYYNETDRNLFYTACTRAMHELVMITTEKPCLFINEAPQSSYVLEFKIDN